jgi:hypothetical protein
MKTYRQLRKEFDQKLRDELREGLSLCTPQQRRIFVLMYARNKENPPDFERVVQSVPHEKLEWAMQQVQNTLNKRKRS